MFKKISLAVMALVFGMSSCSEESCDHVTGGSGELSTSLVGSWYEEAENEEMRFSESGAPDKPCGVGRADANPKLLLNDT